MWPRYYFILLLVCLPFTTTAQVGTFQSVSSGSQPPSIELNPSFPGPGESFTATIKDFGGTLFGSQITWTYNGEVVEASTNQRSAELTAGAAGSDDVLQVTLNTPKGTVETITQTISPLYIDIIFEPQTRVPDWYAGRALPSTGSQVNATALINDGTNFIASDNLVYTWQVNRVSLEGGPIRGGNKVSFAAPNGSTPVVVVTVADTRGNTIARRGMVLTTVKPDIAYYEKHSLYGVKELPLQSTTAIIGNILTIHAEPFNLDTRVYNQPDIAQWEINSRETDNGVQNPYEITLTRAGVSGSTILNFHVRSLQTILQGAEANIRVNF